MAPELVCLSYQILDGVTGERGEPQLVDHREAGALMAEWLADPAFLLVGHNVQYDVAVMLAEHPQLARAFFDAYEADRITDTKWREILLDTAMGTYRWRTDAEGKRRKVSYGLANLASKYLGKSMKKEGGPRTTYGQYRGVPISSWPGEYVHYAKDDAVTTLDCYVAQERFREAAKRKLGLDFLGSQFREARAYFAFQLMQVWGLRTDKTKVMQLERETRHEMEAVQERLMRHGLVRENGVRNLAAAKAWMIAACARKGIPVPMTDPTPTAPEGNVCLDSDACDLTDDDVMEDYARYGTLGQLISKDVKLLLAGIEFPVHTSIGFAESDRTTSAGPNVQNFARSI